MKILIDNTVPMNNGDAALVFSIGDLLEEKGHEVTYAGTQYEESAILYPDKRWIDSILSKRIVKIPFLGYIVLFLYVLFNQEIKKYDAVISAPGGYVNSYYSSLKRKLQLLTLYKKINHQKIYIYSQSIGPLNRKDEILVKTLFPKFDLIYVRDEISFQRINDLGLADNIKQTKDAAFLLDRLYYDDIKKETIAISVRSWGFDDRNEEVYIKLIHNIIRYFSDKKYEIVFLSTCQGIESYRDDSKMAKKIYDLLPANLKNNVVIDDKYYNLYDLRQKLKEFKFVIGTRLHMCILSWLSSTAALNISYEEKGKECYKYLNLEEFSLDYNYSGEVNLILDRFIEINENQTFEKIAEIKKESLLYFNKMIEDIFL